MADMREIIATKADLEQMEVRVVDEVSRRVIQSNDRVVTKLDTMIQDFAAHDSLHKRITDHLHDHDTRIKKLEQTKAG